jgi:hypothetical protein
MKDDGNVRGGDGGDVVIEGGASGLTIIGGTIKGGDGGDAVGGGVDLAAELQRLQALFEQADDTERAATVATIKAEIKEPEPDAGKIARFWSKVQAGATISAPITSLVTAITPAIEAIIH